MPDSFNLDFLEGLGFASSSDRPIIKLLKYLGCLTGRIGHCSHTRDLSITTNRRPFLQNDCRTSFDDLFNANPDAYSKSSMPLKGWFKSKTGVSDSVAMKLASQFRALADYADFKAVPPKQTQSHANDQGPISPCLNHRYRNPAELVWFYRFEIHLPDDKMLRPSGRFPSNA